MPVNIDPPIARRLATLAFFVLVIGLMLWVLSPLLAALTWARIPFFLVFIGVLGGVGSDLARAVGT